MGRDADGDVQERRILCAFRNPALRRELSRLLERSGYAASVAGSAVELVDAVVRETPDLVLLDGGMGGGQDNGLALLEALRGSGAVGSELAAVLFCSGEAPDGLGERARALGARLFQGKRIDGRTLRALIERTLQGVEDTPTEGELLSLCERARSPNPFEALGLLPTATPAEIRSAYEELTRLLAPEALVQTSAELRQISERAVGDLERAYSKLDPQESLERYRRAPDQDQTPVEEREAASPSAPGEAAYREGHALLDRRDWVAALGAFQDAVKLSPQRGEFHAYVGWATYLAYGSEPSVFKEAIEHAKRGMKLSPDHFAPPLVLGRLYQLTNRLDLALKVLKRAVTLNPGSVEAVRELRITRMRGEKRSGKGFLARLLRR